MSMIKTSLRGTFVILLLCLACMHMVQAGHPIRRGSFGPSYAHDDADMDGDDVMMGEPVNVAPSHFSYRLKFAVDKVLQQYGKQSFRLYGIRFRRQTPTIAQSFQPGRDQDIFSAELFFLRGQSDPNDPNTHDLPDEDKRVLRASINLPFIDGKVSIDSPRPLGLAASLSLQTRQTFTVEQLLHCDMNRAQAIFKDDPVIPARPFKDRKWRTGEIFFPRAVQNAVPYGLRPLQPVYKFDVPSAGAVYIGAMPRSEHEQRAAVIRIETPQQAYGGTFLDPRIHA